MKHLTLNPSHNEPPTRDNDRPPPELPAAKQTRVHPTAGGGENARLLFVGTATVILEWAGIRIMTDPNFLHAGDHVHLGPGVQGTRLTNPSLDLESLPRIDAVLLSHYHADHFDQKVEASLRRSLPIITTPHARTHLVDNKPSDEAFTSVHSLDVFDDMLIDITPTPHSTASPALKIIATPGKHVPPGPFNLLGAANDFLAAVPPTNGWIVELGYTSNNNPSSTSTSSAPNEKNETKEDDTFTSTYRIYISGDTLLVPELEEIPKRFPHVDLMLVHLGGTTIPSPSLPLVMVTMDAEMGVKLVELVGPDLTVPVHYDDYDVFLSPLEDFKKAMEAAGLSQKAVYLDRGDAYSFQVPKTSK